MTSDFLLAVTAIGKETRFAWFDWNWIVPLGFLGSVVFGSRFIVQWQASEKAGESVIPISFWYLSILGSAILSIYFLCRRDPIGVLCNLPNSLIYLRNLALIRKKKRAMTAAAPSQTPVEH